MVFEESEIFAIKMRLRIVLMTLLTSLFSMFWTETPALSTVSHMAPSKCRLQTDVFPAFSGLHIINNPTYQIFYAKMPKDTSYKIVPVVSSQIEPLERMVKKVEGTPIAGINAGYFDPSNKQTTSFIYEQGQLVADPEENRHFVDNPELQPYLNNMLNHRSEFRVLACKGEVQYKIEQHQNPVKFGCKLISSVQAGPNLFVADAPQQEAFVAYHHGRIVRDPIGVHRKNARSAIGIDTNGDIILAMAAMKPLKDQASGVTLPEMAQVMHDLGATQAMSLDGGSSSSLWVEGKTYYGKLDKSLKPVKRPIKSALVVIREE